MKAKIHEFYDEIYRFQWVCIIGGTVQEAIDYYTSRLGITTYSPCEKDRNPDAHFSAYRPFKAGLIWFKDKKSLTTQAAHECFHATMYLFERLDMQGPVETTEEVFAYYMQWLIKMITKVKR